MRAGWAALLACALVPGGCGEREQAPPQAPPLAPSPQAWAAAIDAAPPGDELAALVRDLGGEPVDAALDPAGAPAGNDEPGALTTPPPACLDAALIYTSYRERGRQAELCGDRNDDGMVDQCARFDLGTGALASVEQLEVVEEGGEQQVAPQPMEALDWRGDQDDDRVTVVDDTVQVCPPDRACVRFQPTSDPEASVVSAWADPGYQVAAAWIGGTSDEELALEFWDLARGRRLARHAISSSTPVELHGVGAEVYVVTTERDLVRLRRFGRDGRALGVVAAAQRHLVAPTWMPLRGAAALVDQDEAADGPATLVWVGPGGRTSLTPLKVTGDFELAALGDTVIAVSEQQGVQMLEVVSLRPRRTRVLRAPSC